MQSVPQLVKAAREIKLRYLEGNIPGLTRKRKGKGFVYLDVFKKPLKDPKILDRVERLVIPPAWKEVWISPWENSHLQATGFDEKGRKQYIYHPDWIALTQENKFSKLPDFALSLPKIRWRIRKDLNSPGLMSKKVIATIVWLLEHTFIRVGNEEYAKQNASFGLTTLRNRHVKVAGQKIRFEFKGKSGVSHLIDISHPQVAKIIKKCIELPGFQIFKCIDDEGKKHVIDSEDVNEYLQSITKQGTTAKDFRTWGGTTLSAVTLKKIGPFESDYQFKKNVNQAVKTVAHHLRNTTSVCRKYYIHPKVINSYQTNLLVPHFEKVTSKGNKIRGLTLNEFAVFELLQKN